MNDQNKIGEVPASRHRGRGCLLWLGASLALLLGLLLVGYMFEPGAEAADAKAFPPPGELVDIGGYRLHINCTGSGSPPVVIDVGWGDWSTAWGLVQPEVAKTTRVCTYDRAGTGWSTELLRLSSNSLQVFADSDHNIQFEEPDAAVAAIIQMVGQIRQTAKK